MELTAIIVAIVAMIATLFLCLLIYYVAGEIIQAMARNDFLFTAFPKPGTVELIIAENKVVAMLANVVGWKLDEQGRFVIDNVQLGGNWLKEELGVVWIGPFRSILEQPKWEWLELKLVGDTKEKTEYIVKTRSAEGEKKPIKAFFFQFTHPFMMKDVEILDNIKVDVLVVTTVFMLNPKRMVTLNKDPVELFVAITSAELRAWMGEMSFDTLKSISFAKAEQELKVNGNSKIETLGKVISRLNGINFGKDGNPIYMDEKPDCPPEYHSGLYGKLGKAIVRMEFLQINTDSKTAEAIQAAKIAELEGEAIIMRATKQGLAELTLAQKRAEAIMAETEALAERVDKTIVKPTGGAGPHVARVLTAEKVAGEHSKVGTWVEGGHDGIVINPNVDKKP